jgi:hypothetical protein
MYHNWYELYVVTKQLQKDLLRQADEARMVDAARKSRKEAKKRAQQGHMLSDPSYGSVARHHPRQTIS